MNLNEFVKEVHNNAVDHGFWEGEREIGETIALIHSEFSEALEEYRANRPMVWYECTEGRETREPFPCSPEDETDCLNYGCKSECKYRGKKPEGIAVELIDGCIRILDLFGRYDRPCSSHTVQELAQMICDNNPKLCKDTPLPTLVCGLHSVTARAGDMCYALSNKARALAPLEDALGMVFYWVSENGIDPEALMVQKHEYNKSRPYKHGKKC